MAKFWTGEDFERARSEGWLVADVDATGVLEIQRDDEAQVFESDDAALRNVKMRARNGCEFCMRALAYIALESKEVQPTPKSAGVTGGKVRDEIRERINVVYSVTAKAVITVGIYDGLMTEEGWRTHLQNNPEVFNIQWEIIEVTADDKTGDGIGEILACNGGEE